MEIDLFRIHRPHQTITCDSIIWAGVATVFIGSILSVFNICTGGCTAAHEYRLFGFSFATVGILFSVALAAVNRLRSKSVTITGVFTVLVSAASGAEIYFLHVQKEEIGQWCPVCVTVAAAAFVLTASIYPIIQKEIHMKLRFGNMAPLLIMAVSFVLGLFVALAGVQPPAFAGEIDNIWFGKKSAKVEVYFV
ncbi:hypothetical protein EG830_01825, partial [bacterium]|nr:hypothetical protein [bacterium]